MINLLPPELNSGYRYARRNVTLQKWVLVLVLVLIGLIALGTYGMLTIKQSANSYNSQVAQLKQQLKKEKLKQTEQKVQDMSSSLRLSVEVLSKEVLFSKLIEQIGSVMPSGTVLGGLNINQLSGALNLTVLSSNYQAATQAQVNLSNPANQIFSKVDIVTITCNSADKTYPCRSDMTALFNKDNQFLFINQGNKQ